MNTPNNTAPVIIAEVEVINDQTPATIPAAKAPERNNDLVTSKGKVVGKQFWFSAKSASELKAEYKAAHPTKSGKQITEMVNESLRSEEKQRTIGALAMVTHLASEGYFADTAKMRKNKSVIEFHRADSAESAAKKEIAEKDGMIAAMMKRLESMEMALKAANVQMPEPTAAQA